MSSSKKVNFPRGVTPDSEKNASLDDDPKNFVTFHNDKKLPVHKPTKAHQILQTFHPINKIENYHSTVPKIKPENKVRFVIISDTHNVHRQIKDLPDGDVLLHCGDITKTGQIEQLSDFAAWLKELPHKHKVVIAGNHDLTLHEDWYLERENYSRWHYRGPLDQEQAIKVLKEAGRPATCSTGSSTAGPGGFTYLEDNSVTIEGYKIYGSPWSAFFHNWAFNIPRGQPSQDLYKNIPDDTDILLTHGPALGAGDLIDNAYTKGERVGCVNLLKRVLEVKPKIHAFGHIHEDVGVFSDASGETLFVNASTCDLSYKANNPVIVVDLDKRV